MDLEKTILDYFSKIPHIVSVALFGSYARHTENAQSDVDIAILCEQAHIPDPFLLITWREAVSALVGNGVDLVQFNKSFQSNFDVKAAEIDDRKLIRIARIRINLRSLRSIDLSALSRSKFHQKLLLNCTSLFEYSFPHYWHASI